MHASNCFYPLLFTLLNQGLLLFNGNNDNKKQKEWRIQEHVKQRKFFMRKKKNKVDSIETGHTFIAYLFL